MSMIPLTAKVAQRWTPPGLDADDPATPWFEVKPASLIERANWRRDVSGLGARWPSDSELLDCLYELVAASGDPEAASYLESIDLLRDPPADPDADQMERAAKAAIVVNALEKSLVGVECRYAELRAARDHFLVVAPIKAVQRFVSNWGGPDLPPFRRAGQLIPMDLLESLPGDYLTPLGLFTFNLTLLSGDSRKN